VKLSLTPAAEQDLVEGALFYARAATARLGQAFISEFERSAGLLIEQPGLGAIWRGTIRRLPLRRFPYNIIYDLKPSEIRVLAIAHQRRKPGFWQGRT
jgi:plasmid stabilization system protein ParE